MKENEVLFYAKGIDQNTIFFPNGEIACIHCPYHKYKTVNGHHRDICVKSYETLTEIFSSIGEDCILKFEEVPNE